MDTCANDGNSSLIRAADNVAFATGSGNHSREAELRRSCLPPTGGPFIKVEVAVVDKPFDRPAPKAPPTEVLLLALPDAAEQRHAVAVKKPPPTPAMMP